MKRAKRMVKRARRKVGCASHRFILWDEWKEWEERRNRGFREFKEIRERLSLNSLIYHLNQRTDFSSEVPRFANKSKLHWKGVYLSVHLLSGQ